MKAILIIFLVFLCVIFCVFLVVNLPKKCPKCKKHSCFCNSSSFKEKKIEYKTVKSETEKKDKKGNIYKEVVSETKPYECSVYSNYYTCGLCGHVFSTTSHAKEKAFGTYNEYRSKKKNAYIIGTVIFAVLFSVILGSIIGISFSNKTDSENNKLQTYLKEKGDGKNYYYETLVGKDSANVEISYSESGYDVGSNRHYRLQLTNYPTKNSHASLIEAGLFFNLSDNKDEKYSLFDGLVGLVNINYDEYSGVGYVFNNFEVVKKYSTTCSSYVVKSNGWSSEFNAYESEWERIAKTALNICITELNRICDDAGFNIYQIALDR